MKRFACEPPLVGFLLERGNGRIKSSVPAIKTPDLGTMRLAMHDPSRTKQSSAAHVAAALILAACAGLISGAYGADAAGPYLGMSKEEIIACAGEPYAKYKSGVQAETLTYHYSGAGPVPAPPGEKKKKDKPSLFSDNKRKKDKNWTCTASLVFENGRLARVSYAHKDVRSPYAWQSKKDPKKQEAMRNAPLPTCSFSLPNCVRQ
jgi:hypothetical protein